MDNKNEEISIVEIIQKVKKYYNYLLSKWVIICIFGFGGALIGLAASFIIKPKYTAHLSFALIEKSPGGGLADLASTFGFAGMLGNNNGAFSGDNLLEILKSRNAIEKTLLTQVEYKGQKTNLIELYININNLRKTWSKSEDNKKLLELSYPIIQNRNSFSRTQDSVLNVVFNKIINSQSLRIARKDKKLSFVTIDFSSKDEIFSKIFVETLIDQTYQFYKETKTLQSKKNIEILQQKADSVRSLYETAMYKGASFSAANINPALQTAAVPRLKQESDARLYGTVYTEILKNLETLKLDLSRETPILQIIDKPILPLEIVKFGKLKGLIFGGLTGGCLIVGYLLLISYFREIRNSLNIRQKEK